MCRLLPRYPDFNRASSSTPSCLEQQGFANGLKKQTRGRRAAGARVITGELAIEEVQRWYSGDDLRLHLAQRRLWADADRGDDLSARRWWQARAGRGRIRGRGWRDRRADAAG
jgi:hypothetical protein